MTEPRKPIFGFLWATPDPNAPLDAAYVQVRPVRVTARGPLRLAMLVVTTLITTAAAGAAIMAALVSRELVPTIITAGVAATAIFLILRGWVVGTFVSDEAVRIESTWRRREMKWSDVQGIATLHGRCPFLGIPVRVAGDRVVLTTVSGDQVPTHLYTTSPDLWLRPEAFDIARLRLERWTTAR